MEQCAAIADVALNFQSDVNWRRAQTVDGS